MKGKELRKKFPMIDWRTLGYSIVAGVDEAGRGCLAGPVFAAAVILPDNVGIRGLTDSKLIDPEMRSKIAEEIKSEAVAWSVGQASVDEIDSINILRASLLAMKRAVDGLIIKPEILLIDGSQITDGPWLQRPIVKGDLRCQPISAASILAKTSRDELMEKLDLEFPGYELAVHKGYATQIHRQSIARLGPAPIHRKTFGGVKEFL